MNELLEKEEKYNLWNFKIGPLHLWPLIRNYVFSKLIYKKEDFSEALFIANKYAVLSPKLWKQHLKTIHFLLANHDYFDALFLGTSGFRYLNKKEHIYENKLYKRYFTFFSKSLNFERIHLGFFPNLLSKSENTFVFETLNLLVKLNEKLNGKCIYNVQRDKIVPFIKAFNFAFPNIISNDYVENIIIKSINKFPIMKNLYFDKILPYVRNKIAFVDNASVLGDRGILTKILHSAGFKVIELQHGYVSNCYGYTLSCIENKHHQSREYMPDYLLMVGDYWLERFRTPSKKIVVGYPYLNEISDKLVKQNIPNTNTILVVSQGTVTERMVNITKKLSQVYSNYKIIFKIHPWAIPFKDRYMSLKYIQNVKLMGNCNIYELIAKSSIIIGYNSTTLFETLKFPGKRVFILKNSDVPDEIGYKFSNIDDLIEAIKDNTKGYQKANPEYFWASNWEERFKNFMESEFNLKNLVNKKK